MRTARWSPDTYPPREIEQVGPEGARFGLYLLGDAQRRVDHFIAELPANAVEKARNRVSNLQDQALPVAAKAVSNPSCLVLMSSQGRFADEIQVFDRSRNVETSAPVPTN